MVLFVKKSKPWRPHGVLVASKAFLRSSHCVLRSSMWCSMELARRFHCVCAVLLAFAPRFHGVCAALPRRSSTVETRWKRRENSMDAVGTPWKRHGLPRRLHYDLRARPRSPRRVDEVLTALPRRPHGALIRTPSDGVCFEHVQKKRRPLAF